ncbi:unnamed protein product [Acanthoscelides obtectus]|uniref:MADF domain-containing protein n=1 Tax=Acanthoscelides obtectus TaxID=200917 RepID=A0A9P0KC76_ACAOB|nr:unnamed protein product [Acanthoscelides obtectus]CAK1671966.1 hypothetical protein AOBTE_LOCUS28574 [Acanthoscelides obtectus]
MPRWFLLVVLRGDGFIDELMPYVDVLGCSKRQRHMTNVLNNCVIYNTREISIQQRTCKTSADDFRLPPTLRVMFTCGLIIKSNGREFQWSDELVLDLIYEIEQRRHLWDPKDKDKKNRNKKSDAFKSLGNKLGVTPEEIIRKYDHLLQSVVGK